MTDYKLVPMEPTPEMVSAAADAYMPFGDMDLALRMAILVAPAVQGEPVAWQLRTPEGRVILNKEFPAWADGGDGYKITPLYTAPQPAEQKPSLQSPPDDPLGGLEHRADGESNFYTLSRPTGNWVARIQFNGELHTHEQERILNAMLSDRNVRYGDGYHQGYWDARQKSPDVAGLERALKSMVSGYMRLLQSGYDRITDLGGDCDPVDVMERDDAYLREARATLAAHRKQGGE